MKTLKDHNEIQEGHRLTAQITKRAGVACDKCGAGLLYAGDGVNAAIPPSRWVKCPECGRRDLMY